MNGSVWVSGWWWGSPGWTSQASSCLQLAWSHCSQSGFPWAVLLSSYTLSPTCKVKKSLPVVLSDFWPLFPAQKRVRVKCRDWTQHGVKKVETTFFQLKSHPTARSDLNKLPRHIKDGIAADLLLSWRANRHFQTSEFRRGSLTLRRCSWQTNMKDDTVGKTCDYFSLMKTFCSKPDIQYGYRPLSVFTVLLNVQKVSVW